MPDTLIDVYRVYSSHSGDQIRVCWAMARSTGRGFEVQFPHPETWPWKTRRYAPGQVFLSPLEAIEAFGAHEEQRTMNCLRELTISATKQRWAFKETRVWT